MDDTKRLDDTPVESNDTAQGAIKDEGWSEVDLHDRKKTPASDVPSDVEPEGG